MTTYQPTQSDILNYDPNEEFTYPEPTFKLNKSLLNVLAIDNLPLTEESKAEKMSAVIQKVFEKKASVVPIDFYMPIDSTTGQTKGFAFVEFSTPAQAKAALEKVQGFAFTKKNELKLYSVSDWEKYETFDEQTMEKPTVEPYKEQEDLSTWLTDEQARDQYAIKHHDTVQVLWNDPHHKLVPVHSRDHWTETDIMWSPQGSYLVTFHKKGLALWGGENWKNQSSLSFKNVRLCHFSPNEKYVVAMNDEPVDNVAIFDVRTRKKEIFTAPDIIARLPEGRWPVFHWSYDSKYFARLGKNENELEVYESATMKLLGGKPLIIDGIQSFSWCPNKNIIAYWSPEHNGIPAKIALMELPKLRDVRSKNLFKVLNVQMIWHPDGDYLSAVVDSEVVKKSSKVKQTTLELFRMNQKGVPVEVQEVKESFITLSWEPKGDRFAMIHGDQQLKKHVSFYTMNGPNQSCKLQKMLEPKQVDSLFWSPRGINLIIANTKSSTATLEFWDVNELQQIGYGEHFGMTNATWDPTGRYFCTYVSAHKRAADLGFIIWTFLGRTLHKNNVDMLYEFHWRPRPPTLLTPAQEKKVKKNFKDLAKQIEREVKARDEKVKEGLLKKRQEQWDEFMDLLARIKEEYAEMREERAKIRGYESDEEEWYDVKEETVEQVVEIIEEEITN